MAIDYVQLLRDLVDERESSIKEARPWLEQNPVDLKKMGNVVVVNRRNQDTGTPDKSPA